MVKLRLKRLGRKFNPHYRIVAIQARTKREGKPLEELGHFSPMSKEIVLKKDRIEYWLSVGAQPTETVENILIKEKMLPARKHKRVFDKSPKRKSQERAKEKESAKAETKTEVVAEEKVEVSEETKTE